MTQPSLPILKRLFALSGNRCAFAGCQTPIIQGGTVIGQVCHIKGARVGAARYDAQQTDSDRDAYENLILLCSPHHKIIDSSPRDYPVELLREMKRAQEQQTAAMSDADAETGARLLIQQSITSIGQTGGVTAHQVTIQHYYEATATPSETSEEKASPSPEPDLRAPKFVEGDSYLIDRTASVDLEGRANEFIYWHYGPGAWLRVIPDNAMSFRRAELQKLVAGAVPGLYAFGAASHSRVFASNLGTTVVGFDGEKPDTIATRITQVVLNGEMWGHNHVVVESVNTNGIRKFRIRWPAMKEEFEHTLRNYLAFARQTLSSSSATVVPGLALVLEAEFVREKLKWYTETPKITRCQEMFVSRAIKVPDLASPATDLLDPFYDAVFDACTLDYAEEPKVFRGPNA